MPTNVIIAEVPRQQLRQLSSLQIIPDNIFANAASRQEEVDESLIPSTSELLPSGKSSYFEKPRKPKITSSQIQALKRPSISSAVERFAWNSSLVTRNVGQQSIADDLVRLVTAAERATPPTVAGGMPSNTSLITRNVGQSSNMNAFKIPKIPTIFYRLITSHNYSNIQMQNLI